MDSCGDEYSPLINVPECADPELATHTPPQALEFNAFLPRGTKSNFALEKAGNLINPRLLSASGRVLRALSSVALSPGRPNGSVPRNENADAYRRRKV